MSHGLEANWTTEDRFHLANLSVPIPPNELKRVEILRKSKLLDVSTNDTGFSRFTSLASRLFNVRDQSPIAPQMRRVADRCCCSFADAIRRRVFRRSRTRRFQGEDWH